jgi:hypothetical protein
MNLSDFVRCRISNLKLRYLRWIIKKYVVHHDVVVDIGCGKTILDYVQYEKLYRIDPCLIEEDDYNIQGTWDDALVTMRTIHPDCVFLMDVIEHLPKEEALVLLGETELITKQIVVFTPFGFMPQEDGEWNTHRSGWVEEDFGVGWKTWVLPRFHVIDFRGKVLDTAVSGLLAIYTRGT